MATTGSQANMNKQSAPAASAELDPVLPVLEPWIEQLGYEV